MAVKESWMSPMNRARFARAFKSKSRKIKIRDGRTFNLIYRKQKLYDEDTDVVLVRPTEGYAPMGYFRMERVLDPDWITESDRQEPSTGLYLGFLDEFIDKPELRGIIVTEQWPELEGRKIETLRNGFAGAKSVRGRKASNVSVMIADGEVYLLKGQP
jgi:hypothetical protein